MTFSDGSNFRACNALAYEHLVHHADALKSRAIKMSVGKTAQRRLFNKQQIMYKWTNNVGCFSVAVKEINKLLNFHCLIH